MAWLNAERQPSSNAKNKNKNNNKKMSPGSGNRNRLLGKNTKASPMHATTKAGKSNKLRLKLLRDIKKNKNFCKQISTKIKILLVFC